MYLDEWPGLIDHILIESKNQKVKSGEIIVNFNGLSSNSPK